MREAILREAILGQETSSTAKQHDRPATLLKRHGSWLAFLVLLLWLTLVGIALWQKAQAAVQPPVYDAATYFQKASNVWAGLRAQPMVNPLNVAPTVRPPGTVLVSGPFGFNPDFRSFYFRSTFLPIIAFALAIFIAVWNHPPGSWSQWDLLLATIFLTTLPLFYHLEPVEGVYWPVFWGLVDNFLAGIAAIGAACILRSVRNVSASFLVLGSLIGALCVFIKPAGFLILILLAVAWFCSMLFGLKYETDSRRKARLQRLLWFGLVLFGAVCIVVVLGCYRTEYFSTQNIQFGKTAVSLLKAENVYASFSLWTKIRSTFGVGIFISLGIVLLCLAFSQRRMQAYRQIRAVGQGTHFPGFLYLAVGCWFWWGSTGGDIIRYFFPFALMTMIAWLPAALEAFSMVPFGWRMLVRGVWLVTIMGLLILLLQSNPASSWQRVWGVNLSSGEFGAEVRQAEQFVQELRSEKHYAYVYSLDSGDATRAFESVSSYESTIHPAQTNFYVRLPIDWQSIPGFNIDGILNSDYVVFSPVLDQNQMQAARAQTLISSYAEQKLVFNAWFSELTPEDGVSVKSETPHNRLLKIEDPMRLMVSLNRLLEAHSWSDHFRKANSAHWFSQQDLEDSLKQNHPLLDNVSFNHSYRLDALEVETEGDSLKVNVWWESLQAQSGPTCFFFVHFLDANGTIIGSGQFMLKGKMYHPEGRSIRLDSVRYTLQRDVPIVTLGVGVYRPEGGLLLPDKGTRDWGGQRIVIPLTKRP